MKMPRSQCESENVQFVQELAEVDGPFEAPININFRDLTKLELPSLVWNRGDTCPKKMKITNTGHTVIVSGKWKCERPYLTGGPLLGKYVFSQIHFHWGQDDCKGSEHQICGEGFPLEMHVAHFKTEYMTQECALREKDGMVVVVYLFRLQEEPNQSLKKIINCLPNVKQPSTSQAIDPRPILSLCNPFTDDYFMYWGSVVTSTCAHILLWIICREPFGISREQVSEFRKIMDSCQQPIFRNSRDIQPIHKRNVFHVNASKHLEEPLLPVKKLLGCYCKGSKDNGSVKHSNECNCRGHSENQEDVEGSLTECIPEKQGLDSRGMQTLHFETTLSNSCFAKQTFFVHTAQVQSLSIVLKRCGSDPLGNYCHLEKKIKSESFNEFKKNQLKFMTQSCCFLPLAEVKKIKNLAENRKTRERKKLFNSIKAFSQIMQSLETLKNQTFKKLKEIESINQEIKEIKPFCKDTEQKKWIRRIEKMMTRQKRLTMKSSQGCLNEIKKLAKDSNFDKYFDARELSDVDRNQKVWVNIDETTNDGLPCYDNFIKGEGIPEIKKPLSKYIDVNKAAQFSSEAQKLIESFFEDIKDSEDLQETVKKDMNLKKIKSFYSKQGDSNSIVNENKGYITQKMFTLGNLGNRFFTEVITEDNYVMDANQQQYEEFVNAEDVKETKNTLEKYESEKTIAPHEPVVEKTDETDIKSKSEALIPLHRANVGILLSKTNPEKTDIPEIETHEDLFLSNEEKTTSHSENLSDMESVSNEKKSCQKKKSDIISLKKSVSAKCKKFEQLMNERMLGTLEAKVLQSGSDFSSESTETQKMIFAKIRQSKKDFWEYKREKSLSLLRVSSKRLYNRGNCRKFEGYYIQKKNPKIKKSKSHKSENMKLTNLYGVSSTSIEDSNLTMNNEKWQRVAKAKFKLEIQKTSDSTSESGIENILISPDRKRLKLECKKFRGYSSKESSHIAVNSNDYLTNTEILPITNPSPRQESEYVLIKKTAEEEYSAVKSLKENFSEKQNEYISESTRKKSRNVSGSSSNRSLRDSSVDSKLSHVKSEELIKLDTCNVSFDVLNETLRREPENIQEAKPVSRNKIANNTTNTTGLSAEFTQRIHIESLDDRKKSNKDSFIPRRIIDSPRKIKERLKNTNSKYLPCKVSNEICKKPDGEPQDCKTSKRGFESHPQTPTKIEYEVGFFTTSSQGDNELLPLNHAQPEKSKMIKHIGVKKYQLAEKSPHECNPCFQEHIDEHPEILHRTDSKDASKGNTADSLTLESKDLQISVSCSTLKKSPLSRLHSMESLLSQTKTLKRKGKKRPHCCKRNSRHYMRKNSSIFKKPNKAEKPLNFLNLTDEEQLKIISVNVAKYIKEKLVEENGESVCNHSSLNNAEEVNVKAKDFQEKKETTSEKTPSMHEDLDRNPRTTSGAKPKDKKEEKPKRTGTLRKPKVIKTHIEVQEEKSLVAPPKPINNFIKLNKQMAGKYKKLPHPPVKKVESKEKLKIKQKSKLETKPPTEAEKPKAKSPKKKKEKVTSPELKEQFSPRAETPKSTKSLQLSPKRNFQKESQIKSPRSCKKPDMNATEPSDKPEPQTSTEESNQLMKCESNLTTLPPSSVLQKTPRPKKCLIPTYVLTSYLPSPVKLVESQTSKINKCILSMNKTEMSGFQPNLMYENKTKSQEEIKKESLFNKELEYFIKLQMCLNNDISTELESPLNYVKSKLLQKDQKSANLQVNDPLGNSHSDIKQGNLVETKDLAEYSSSCSELTKEMTKHKSGINEAHNGNESNFKNKGTLSIKTMRESGDFGNTISGLRKEKQEETNSDSSYDCKISITLNTNPKDGDSTVESYDLDNWLGENSSCSQKIHLKETVSQSTVMKPLPKKRNESDISIEMKEKLLEILEAEIKKGVAIKCGGSPENSSDGLTLKEEESDGNNQSRSTESSCDNIDVLAQISNTMRHYLTYMKHLPDKKSQVCDESQLDFDVQATSQ